jgi:hypothetical protein
MKTKSALACGLKPLRSICLFLRLAISLTAFTLASYTFGHADEQAIGGQQKGAPRGAAGGQLVLRVSVLEFPLENVGTEGYVKHWKALIPL